VRACGVWACFMLARREGGRERERERERERGRERENEKEGEREKERCRIWLLNLFHCF
jgi:hypothetical protein